nr:hypothetical protein HK105_004130 [Polyrhizophydium stewartii]
MRPRAEATAAQASLTSSSPSPSPSPSPSSPPMPSRPLSPPQRSRAPSQAHARRPQAADADGPRAPGRRGGDAGPAEAPKPRTSLAGGLLGAAMRTLVSPVVNVVLDVSHFYSQRIYRFMLGRRNPRKHFQYLMEIANCYEQWAAAGYMLDRCEGADRWKNEDNSSHYDHDLIRDRLDMLRSIRKSGDTSTIMFTLRTSLTRNLGDMGNSRLYGHSHVGTKALIEDYIDEVTKQLNFICDIEIPDVSIPSKIEFFTNIQRSFGRTALLLSGGGTFGLVHIGVCKSLFEVGLLPKIITGSSGGAIVASVICTRTDDELPLLMDPRIINLDVFERPSEQGNPFLKIARLLKHVSIIEAEPAFQLDFDQLRAGVFFDVQVFTDAMRQNLGDMTFQEAYNRTRRILNITVSSSTNYEMPRLLNYLTAPNVRISELFGVNHFLVSQVNPHIIPFMSSQNRAPSVVTEALVELGFFPSLFSRVKSIVCQKYWGDITIVPYLPWSKYPLILANPTTDMVTDYIIDGEHATWPKIAIIRNHCSIEQCINQNILNLRKKLFEGISSAPTASAGVEPASASGLAEPRAAFIPRTLLLARKMSSFLAQLRTIAPRVKRTANRLEILVMEPTLGDWIIAGGLCLFGAFVSYYTTSSQALFWLSTLMFVAMAYTLIDDKYVMTIDKAKGEVSVTKSKLGRIKWQRVSSTQDLVNCEVVGETHRGLTSFRIELEFMSDFGFYRMPASESTVVGDVNKAKFDELAKTIVDFMKLKPAPEWMKEGSLAAKLPPRKKSGRGSKTGMLLPLTNYGVRCMSMGFLVGQDAPVVWRGLMILGMVQNMSFYCCPKCNHQEHIFGKDGVAQTAKAMNVDVLADVPLHSDVVSTSDTGKPITITQPRSIHAQTYMLMARRVLDKLAAAPLSKTTED